MADVLGKYSFLDTPDVNGTLVLLVGDAAGPLSGTANQITASAATGAVTLSLPSLIITPGDLQVTGFLKQSVSATVSAAGATQGTATAITSRYNIVTTAAAGTGVILPLPVTPFGRTITIVNRGANPVNVYPNTGAAIDGAAANAPVSIPVSQEMTVFSTSVTQWQVSEPVIVAGTNITVTPTAGTLTVAATGGSGTVTSVGVSSSGTYAAALTIGSSPVTTSGTITVTPNLFTTSTAGIAPASGGGTSNFLRADGTWNAPAAGSPGGSDTQVQYNNAGAFAGAANVNIDNSDLLLDFNASPVTPPTNAVKLFDNQIATRNMLAIVGPSGLDTVLQPHLARNKVALWNAAGNATTITTLGAGTLTSTGTASTANVATTNIYTYQKKVEYLVTTPSTTAVAGWRYPQAQWTIGGTAAGLGGFHFITRWGPATGVATTTNRCFVGMASSTAAPTDVEPSTITNMCGVGWDAADTNMQFMYRGAGAVTKVDLGASFPVPTTDRTITYEIAMFTPPGTTQTLGYQVTVLGSGGVTTSGTVSTGLPATSTLLAPRGWMSVGGTSSVIGIAMISVYIESDY